MNKTWKAQPGETPGELFSRAWAEIQREQFERIASRMLSEGYSAEEVEEGLAVFRDELQRQMVGGASVN